MKIERGRIYMMAERGDYTGKPRPVVVMQNPNVQLESVIVVPLTSYDADGSPIRVEIEPTLENGLQKRSFAMCDKITMIPKAKLGIPIGAMNIGKLSEIKQVIIDLVDEGEPLDEAV